MDKLMIPEGCVIRDGADFVGYTGDIVIESGLRPKQIDSDEGCITFKTDQDHEMKMVNAPGGVVQIKGTRLQVEQLTALSCDIHAIDLDIRNLAAGESAKIRTDEANLGTCRVGDFELNADSVKAESITADGEIILHANLAVVREITAKRVIVRGSIDCKKLVATESVVVESGNVAIKFLDTPSFFAAPEVTGVIPVATSTDVKAEGVRGFLHPSELGMLTDHATPMPAPEDINTTELVEAVEAVTPPPSFETISMDDPLPDQDTSYETTALDSQDLEAIEPEPVEPEPDEEVVAVQPDEGGTQPVPELEEEDTEPDPEPPETQEEDLESLPAEELEIPELPDEDETTNDENVIEFPGPTETEPEPELEVGSQTGFMAPIAPIPDDTQIEESPEPFESESFEEQSETEYDHDDGYDIMAVSESGEVMPADPDPVLDVTIDNLPPIDAFKDPEPDDEIAEIEEPELPPEPVEELEFQPDPFGDDSEIFEDADLLEDGDLEGDDLGGDEDLDGPDLDDPIGEVLDDDDEDEAFDEIEDLGDIDELAEADLDEITTDDLEDDLPDDLEDEFASMTDDDMFEDEESESEESDVLEPPPFADEGIKSGVYSIDQAVEAADDFDTPPENNEALSQVVDSALDGAVAGLNDSVEESIEDLDELDVLEVVENPEDVAINELEQILEKIRAYFPEDNYPQFINQIRRYLDDRRLSLFYKESNRKAVLSSFDKFNHEEISKLARTFFERVEAYRREVS